MGLIQRWQQTMTDRLAKSLAPAVAKAMPQAGNPSAYDTRPFTSDGGGLQTPAVNLSVPAAQLAAYTWAPAVYSGIKYLASIAAGQTFRVFAEQADGRREEQRAHAWIKLFMRRPNDRQAAKEVREELFTFLAGAGNAYLWGNRATERATPDEIQLIPAHQMRPHPDGHMGIDGYEYYPEGQAEPLFVPTWQVCHFKTVNPLNRYVGLSFVQVIALSLLTNRSQRRWNYNNFGKYNAKVPGVIAFPDPIPDPLWDRMKVEFYEDTGGTQRQVMLMRNTGQGTPKWIPMYNSPAEMEFLASLEWSTKDIYDQVAPGLYTLLAKDVTEANGRIAKATLYELAIWPMLQLVHEKITQDVLPAYGPNLIGEFDDPRMTDRAMELQEMDAYSRVHTVKEIRAKYYEDEPLGDERDDLLPAQVQPDSGLPEEEKEPIPAALLAFQQGQPQPQQADDDTLAAQARGTTMAGEDELADETPEAAKADYTPSRRPDWVDRYMQFVQSRQEGA